MCINGCQSLVNTHIYSFKPQWAWTIMWWNNDWDATTAKISYPHSNLTPWRYKAMQQKGHCYNFVNISPHKKEDSAIDTWVCFFASLHLWVARFTMKDKIAKKISEGFGGISVKFYTIKNFPLYSKPLYVYHKSTWSYVQTLPNADVILCNFITAANALTTARSWALIYASSTKKQPEKVYGLALV